ncbi:tetratricopeptide repeat protein [Martelella endophytica]|uniref:tetratricopeptide repeat protein n=1 Tax=Martelella endophytica TaxID=1486262 RepID=UPI0006984AAA|nr:tetratricopeptide repeat protein [Martelella endophytica]
MKLAYIALSAGAIAMIGAIGMNGSGSDTAARPALAQQGNESFQDAYDKMVDGDAPAPAPQPQPGFSSVREAQAQDNNGDLRNLPDQQQSRSGDVTQITRSQNTDTTQSAPEAPVGPRVDESALRYFAQQGDLQRLQAEISRLRSLYPNWTPPANPLAVEDGTDEQLNTMWEDYAQGNYQEVRQLIQQRQQEEPDWKPPADLLNRLHIAETRVKLLQAADDGNYAQVIDLASQAPSLLTCAEINLLWQVGEAFAKTDKLSRAMDDYTYILKNCDNPQERLATMQKALEFMPFDDMKTLLSYERTNDAGQPEFQEIRDTLLRDRFAEAGDDKTIVIAPEDLARMEQIANESKDPDDSQLLAWYFLIRDSENAAEEWFRKARDEGDSATISQGLALILIGQDRPDEAEAIMYPWRDSSAEAMDTYLNAVVNMLGALPRRDYSPEVLKRMADVVTTTKSATAAQQFGWYSHDFGQPLAALQWFEAALSYEPWDEPAAYGVTLMLNDMNYRPGVYLMQKVWAPYSERIAWLNDPYAPVTSLEDLTATVFELRSVEQPGGKSQTVAVPIAEINLATGQQEPITSYAQEAMATTDPLSGGQGVALTAPRYYPGAEPLMGAPEDTQQLNNYVPEYYQYYYGGQNAAGTTAAAGGASAAPVIPGMSERQASLAAAFARLNVPESMIKTDPITGVQTVTIINSALRNQANGYQPSAAQIQAAFYTTGEPSEKTEIYRFDQQAYANRDYLRQFEINTYLDPDGTNQPALANLAGTTTSAATTTTTTRRASSSTSSSSSASSRSSGGSSSSGSCWSGSDPGKLSPDAALRQGWCLMDLQRPMEAVRAFEVALGSSSSKNREDAAYGQSLAYMRLGLDNKAAVAAAQEPLSSDRQLGVQVQLLTNRAIAAYQGGHYNDALLILDQRNQLAPEQTDLMAIRGYAYYNLKRYRDAMQVFSALAEMGNRKGMEGLALTRNQLGLSTN